MRIKKTVRVLFSLVSCLMAVKKYETMIQLMIVTTLLPVKPLRSQLDFGFLPVDQLNYVNEVRLEHQVVFLSFGRYNFIVAFMVRLPFDLKNFQQKRNEIFFCTPTL